MMSAPTFVSLVSAAVIIAQVEVPTLVLAGRLPARHLPWPVFIIAPVGIVAPLWLFIAGRWVNPGVDVVTFLLTFALLLLLNATVVFSLFKTSIWSALFCASAGYTIQNTASSLQVFFGDIAKIGGPSWPGQIPQLAIVTVVYVLFFALYVRKVRKGRLELVEDRHMLFAFMLSMLVVIGFDIFIKAAAHEGTSPFTCFALRTVHLAFCVSLLFFEYQSLSSSKLEMEATIDRHIIAERSRQYEQSRLSIEAVNQRMHDLVHSVATSAAERGATDDPLVDELLAQIMAEVRHYDAIIRTGNEALDTVLTEKSLVCEQEGFRLMPIADGHAVDFLDAADVYVLFGGLLDTAIEQVKLVADAPNRDISLQVRRVGDLATIHVERYCGEAEGPEGHGLDTPDRIVSTTIDRLGGTLTADVMDGVVSVTVSIPLP